MRSRTDIPLPSTLPAKSEARAFDVVYLACPYSHPDAGVRAFRFETATKVAADMIKSGRIVYSPITMTHPIDIILAGAANTLGSEYWLAFDEAFMDMCSELVVIKLAGWEQSDGIAREIEYFRARAKPISFVAAPVIT